MSFLDKAKKFGKKFIIADGVDDTVSTQKDEVPQKAEEPKSDEVPQKKVAETPAEDPQKPNSSNNGVNLRNDTIEDIIEYCRPAMTRKDDKYAKLKILLVQDPAQTSLQFAWADDDFKEDLRRRLNINMLQNVGKDEISFSEISRDQISSGAHKIREDVYIQFPEPVVPEQHGDPEPPQEEPDDDDDEVVDGRTARLKLRSPEGACGQDEYTFDTAEQSYLNIGRGTEAGLRPNDIAISEEVAPSVSRKHAQIVYRDNHFYLKDFSSNGTQIIRRGEVMKLISEPTNVRYQLKNRDEIVLAGVVRLRFFIDAQ